MYASSIYALSVDDAATFVCTALLPTHTSMFVVGTPLHTMKIMKRVAIVSVAPCSLACCGATNFVQNIMCLQLFFACHNVIATSYMCFSCINLPMSEYVVWLVSCCFETFAQQRFFE